jgi:hypothetical protein
MIAVNQALGYTVLGRPNTDWRFDVAAALGEQALASRARY